MAKHWTVRIVGLALFIFIVIVAGGQAVLQLWNWLVPNLFGLRPLTFWQAVGLLALCRLLFGGFGGFHRHRSDWNHRMKARFENMTPEQREAMRRGMRTGCGFSKAPATEPKA